ncbi:MAG: DUF3194 domain-containing protein [Candidatus Heimdallarchaeota archaeon]|nr:DUF3194 domain-containing protein [Candidatus Heimdallarchaeota archaeon]
MNERSDETDVMDINLRKLSDEDIERISNEAYKFVRHFLSNYINPQEIDEYNIIVDIDYSNQNLQIDIDLQLKLPPRIARNEQKIIEDVLEKSFSELDKLLKEKFTN